MDGKKKSPSGNDSEASTSASSNPSNNVAGSSQMEFILENTEKFLDFLKVIAERTDSKNFLKEQSENLKKSKATKLSRKKNAKEENFAGFTESPPFIHGVMRDYQIDGLNWLIRLYENGINGILADEMGLGKTLQTISLLGYLRHHKGIAGKHLIFAPKSTINNWGNEVKQWLPDMRVITFVGDKNEREHLKQTIVKPQNFDILVTNYEMLLHEKSVLKKIHWSYLVIDEGHRLKNEKNIFSKSVRELKSEHRLILTGTPLQNNLHELWALLNFLLPDIFSSSEDFDTWFDTSTVLASGDTLVQRLHTILTPFFLRRIKSDVEKSLLPKIEYKLYAPITSLQKDLYIKTLKKEFEVFNPSKATYHKVSELFQILWNLRKICNHPYMLPGVEEEPYETNEAFVQVCGKFQLLDKLLVMLRQQESRVLIFSQMKGMLTILEDYLDMRGWKYHRLDGQTDYDERTRCMQEFNEGDSETFVFLLSTRAGGLGINLQAADAVIIYDSDWNPQADRQAEDRAHRIGQKKQVRVFRLISEKTIEERIVERASIKLLLDKKVIQEGRLIENVKLGKNELVGMIADNLVELMDAPLSSITDKSIQEIMKNSQEKSQELDEKVATSVINFESFDTIFKFDGNNYQGSAYQDGILDFSSKSKRKKPIVSYVIKKNPVKIPKIKKIPPLPVIPEFHDFQFYKKPLKKLVIQKFLYYLKISMSPSRIGRKFSPGLQEKIKNASQSNSELRKRLLNNGFDWSLKEFQQYWRWVSRVQQRYSKKVKSGIVKTRSDKQVYRYNQVFWSRFYELKNQKIRQFCQEKLWDHWKPRLEKIRELTGGNFHRMASWRNQYLIGCGFNRQAVVYILEKVYSHESRENLFQELSERIKNSPYEIDFLFPKNWKEGDWEIDRKNCWKPEPENMFFIINKILDVFEMNWKKLQGDKDEKLLGWRRTERNTQFGYRKVEIEEDEESEEEFEEEQELFEYYRKKKEKMRQAELKDNMSIKERLEREETEKKERKERKMEKLKNKPIKEGEKSETEEKETVERLNAKKKRIEKAEKRMEKKQRKIESEKERIVGEIIDLSGSNSTKDQRSTESLNYSENLDISSFMSSFLEQSDDNLDAISISSGEFESSPKSDYKMFETIKVPADSKSIKIKECSVVIDKNLKPKVAAGNKGMLKKSIMDSKGETSTAKQYSGNPLEKCSVVLMAKENQIEKTLKIGVGSKENGSQENSGLKSMNQGSRKHRLDSENLSVVPLKKIKLN